MKAEVITVLTTAVDLAGAAYHGAASAGPGSSAYPTAAILKNPASGVTVYLGGIDVTVALGFPIAAGESLEVDLVNEILYAIVASGSQQINILRRGN